MTIDIVQTLDRILKIKMEVYGVIKSSIIGMRSQINNKIGIIDVHQEIYQYRNMPPFPFEQPVHFGQPFPEFPDGSEEGSISKKHLQAWMPPAEPEKHGRVERKTDLSIVANITPSEDQPEDMDEDYEEEEDTPDPIEITNSFFGEKGGCFINFDQKLITGPNDKYAKNKVRKLSISTPQVRTFFGNKVTCIGKYPGDNMGNMALWIGGNRDMIGLLKNKSDMIALELANPEEQARTFTSHLTYLNGHMIFLTSNYRLIVVELTGQVAFITDLSSLFTRNDYVHCSISDGESNSLILGTNEGKLIVIEIDIGEKCIVPGYSQLHSIKKISSLTWLDEEKKILFATSYDKTCSVLQFQNKDQLIIQRVFTYDLSVSCCVRLGSLLLVAFGNHILSVIEPEKGLILLSVRVNKTKHKLIDHCYINWLGYIFLGGNQEFQRYLSTDFRYNLVEFESFVSKLRFVCKHDDNTIVFTGHPNEPGNQQEVQMIQNSEGAAQMDTRRLPVILDRFTDSDTIRLRYFMVNTAAENQVHSAGLKQIDADFNEEFTTYMGEVDINIFEEYRSGHHQKPRQPNSFSQLYT